MLQSDRLKQRPFIVAMFVMIAFIFVTISSASVQARDKHHNRKAAAIIGVIVGAAIAAKAAKDRDRHGYRHRRYNRRFDDRPKQWHPKIGVTCYRKLRSCYKVGHGYSARWTRREFH